MENVSTIVQMEGPVVNDRWIIKNFSLSPMVGKMKVWASNLFEETEFLSE